MNWVHVEILLKAVGTLLNICWKAVESCWILEYYYIYMSEAEDDQITKEPETPIVKQKDPKKIAAGKKLAEYHRNAKKALEKSEVHENWTPSLTTALTLVGIGLTALDLYFDGGK